MPRSPHPSGRATCRTGLRAGAPLAILGAILVSILGATPGATLGATLGATTSARAGGDDPVGPRGAAAGEESFGRHPIPPDDFRSDHTDDYQVHPVRGGRVVVHLETRPLHLNRVLQSSATAKRLLDELHARLVERNWETWELEPSLASSFEVEDLVVLEGGLGAGTDNAVFGRVSDAGEAWRVEPVSSANPLTGALEVPKERCERVARGTVFTFRLREGVRWHDGHVFDAADVLFSIETYLNPHVPSEHDRHRFERLHSMEALDDHTLRFVFAERVFAALETFGANLTILPAHVFDLNDPDNPDHDPEAGEVGAKRRADYVVGHPANEDWIGLGPYRLVDFNDQFIDAVRFDDYFDRANGGWVDAIRWRIVTGDTAARQALLEGEFDFFTRLRSRDFLGEFCERPEFAQRFEKGTYYTPQMTYLAWNLRRPFFQDVRVRRALAHAFDWQEFIDTIGNGMGRQITASWYCFSPHYDTTLEPYPFDLERAEELLTEAGWFDRDGDGRIDREGIAFDFEYLYASDDVVAQFVGLKLKENLERLGIAVTLVPRDFATRQELVGERTFDAACMTWILDAVTDPFSEWHSSLAALPRSNNQPGFVDARTDELIAAIHAEEDQGRCTELYHELQRRIYEQQPYLFGCLFPTKFAVSKRVRNVQRMFLDPGYAIRRWYIDPEATD